MQYVLLSMFIGALFGGGMAVAQSSGEPARQPHSMSRFSDQFKAADKDGDGALSRTEAQDARLARVVDNFDRIDANKDGKVTHEEIRSLVRSRVSS